MSRQKHTHRGHCQHCGAVQAIELTAGDNVAAGTIAKHGYKVTWGYFSGVCNGSGLPALEFDRRSCDELCKDLLRYAISEDARAFKLRRHDPDMHPAELITGSVPNPEYGRSVTVKRVPRMLDVKTPWGECTDVQRERWYTSAAFTAETNAKSARGHREFLRELAATVHGTMPKAVDRTPRAEVVVGTEFERYESKWRVVSIVRGGYGRGTLYAKCERVGEQHPNASLNRVTMRVQDVRKCLKG